MGDWNSLSQEPFRSQSPFSFPASRKKVSYPPNPLLLSIIGIEDPPDPGDIASRKDSKKGFSTKALRDVSGRPKKGKVVIIYPNSPKRRDLISQVTTQWRSQDPLKRGSS